MKCVYVCKGVAGQINTRYFQHMIWVEVLMLICPGASKVIPADGSIIVTSHFFTWTTHVTVIEVTPELSVAVLTLEHNRGAEMRESRRHEVGKHFDVVVVAQAALHVLQEEEHV